MKNLIIPKTLNSLAETDKQFLEWFFSTINPYGMKGTYQLKSGKYKYYYDLSKKYNPILAGRFTNRAITDYLHNDHFLGSTSSLNPIAKVCIGKKNKKKKINNAQIINSEGKIIIDLNCDFDNNNDLPYKQLVNLSRQSLWDIGIDGVFFSHSRTNGTHGHCRVEIDTAKFDVNSDLSALINKTYDKIAKGLTAKLIDHGITVDAIGSPTYAIYGENPELVHYGSGLTLYPKRKMLEKYKTEWENRTTIPFQQLIEISDYLEPVVEPVVCKPITKISKPVSKGSVNWDDFNKDAYKNAERLVQDGFACDADNNYTLDNGLVVSRRKLISVCFAIMSCVKSAGCKKGEMKGRCAVKGIMKIYNAMLEDSESPIFGQEALVISDKDDNADAKIVTFARKMLVNNDFLEVVDPKYRVGVHGSQGYGPSFKMGTSFTVYPPTINVGTTFTFKFYCENLLDFFVAKEHLTVENYDAYFPDWCVSS